MICMDKYRKEIHPITKPHYIRFFVPTPCIIFLDWSSIMTSFLPFTGRSLDCLLHKPGLMPQSLSSEVSDVRPAHLRAVGKLILS